MRLVPIVLLALAAAGCAAPTPGTDEGAAWSVTATDGNTYGRDDAGTNATVLFFMATWCGSCKQKAPVLTEVHAERGDEVRFLSLDFDPSESAQDLADWSASYAQPWPHGIDEGLRIQRLYGVTTQSTVLVLDADGDLVERFGYGPIRADALGAAIDRALAAASSPTSA